MKHQRVAHLELCPDPPAVELRQPRMPGEPPLLPIGEGAVAARDHPVGAALMDEDLRRLLRDLRDELDGAGRAADDADPFSREVVVVVPARRVEALALEAIESRDVRYVRPTQLPDRADQHLRLVLLAGGGSQAPQRGLVVEAAEKYDKHCVMQENCNYDRPELMVFNMVRQESVRRDPARRVRLPPRPARHQVRGSQRGAVAPRARDPAQRQPLPDARPRPHRQLHGHRSRRPLRVSGVDVEPVARPAGVCGRPTILRAIPSGTSNTLSATSIRR